MTDRSQPIDPIHESLIRAQQTQGAQKMAQYAIMQESAREEFSEWGDLNAWNPMALARNFQTLDQRRLREKQRQDEADKAEQAGDEGTLPVEKLQEVSEQYNRKNPELQARTLLLLRSRITRNDTVEDVLRKIREVYSDPALADEALDFLLETADADTRTTILQAKEELNKLYGQDIKAGKNMGIQARAFSAQGLGSPTGLRDLYREITRTPRDAHTLFQQLSSTFPYEKMKTVIDFLLHSLGAEMKAKGPSISRAELTSLFNETRNMQAILAVFRFFKSRMRMMTAAFDRQGMTMPTRMTFDFLAKIFMKFIQERYPSVDKALLLAQQLGLAEEVEAQIILYLQFRDAIRQVAPKLFRDERHRQDMLMCFIQTLEELDDKLEEEEEKEER